MIGTAAPATAAADLTLGQWSIIVGLVVLAIAATVWVMVPRGD